MHFLESLSTDNPKATDNSTNIRQSFLNISFRVTSNRFGLAIPGNIDKPTAAAMRRLLKNLAGGQHYSITSRRHSISTLIKQELDAAVERVIRSQLLSQRIAVLAHFRLSQAWQRSPAGFALPSESLNRVAAANHRASQWRGILKRAVREANAQSAGSDSETTGRYSRTLDSVIELIDVLSCLKPAHTHEGGQKGKRIALNAVRSHPPHCELCWRPTMFSVLGAAFDANDKRVGTSRRFCTEHSPLTSASAYRRDVACREPFEAEVELLTESWSEIRDNDGPIFVLKDASEPSGHQVHLMPVTPDPQDIRRAAYALVHSKLTGSSSQCWILKQQGLSTKEIAKKIELTERAVRSALSAFDTKLAFADRIRARFDGYA